MLEAIKEAVAFGNSQGLKGIAIKSTKEVFKTDEGDKILFLFNAELSEANRKLKKAD